MAPRTTAKSPAKPAKPARAAAAAQDPRDALIEQLLKKLESQELAVARMTEQLAAAQPFAGRAHSATARAGQMFVGVRNVSNYTISIPSTVTGEPSLDLHAPAEGVADPNTVAIVSYAWWQQLRKGRHYRDGMIVRDDAVLAGNYNPAPPDRPQDCAPEHATNLVLDAEAWIAARDDDALVADVQAMTSEPSLRKLEAVVYLRRDALQDKHADVEFRERKRRVERELPSRYKHLEDAVKDRLKQIADAKKPK
jgi:hypothetical protein